MTRTWSRARAAVRVAEKDGGKFVVTGPRAVKAYAKLPLAFVENQGQADARVRYVAEGSQYAFYLTREEIVLSLGNRFASAEVGPASHRTTLALQFLGANPAVTLKAEKPVAGEVNYFRGTDPARWQTKLARYGQIVYRDLWPGVDMALAGQGGELKYEFRLRPGARLADIRLAYRGSSGLALDSSGALLIETSSGVLRIRLQWHIRRSPGRESRWTAVTR